MPILSAEGGSLIFAGSRGFFFRGRRGWLFIQTWNRFAGFNQFLDGKWVGVTSGEQAPEQERGDAPFSHLDSTQRVLYNPRMSAAFQRDLNPTSCTP
jgi:hypothetical protein